MYFEYEIPFETCIYLQKREVEKLSLENIQINNEDIQKLTKRCNRLTEIDLSNCTCISNVTVTRIIENLSNTLVKLSLPYQIDDFYTLIELKTMPKLKYLWLERFRVPSAKKDSLKSRLANITINEDGHRIACPDELFGPRCGIWDIHCEQTDIS